MSQIISESIIKGLKKVNISKDAEKTKERVSGLWKGATKEDRASILSLAGLIKASAERVYKTGAISAKLVIAIAQTLNVNPFYLTGESDERGECTETQLHELLVAHGYTKLLVEQPVKVSRGRRTSKIETEPLVQEEPAHIECDNESKYPIVEANDVALSSFQRYLTCISEAPVTSEMEAFLEAMTEEDMILLMRSIMIRAKTGGKNAELAKLLKLILTQ